MLQVPTRAVLRMLRIGRLRDISCDGRQRVDVGELAELLRRQLDAGVSSPLATEALAAVQDGSLSVPHVASWERPPSLLELLDERWRAAPRIGSAGSDPGRTTVPRAKPRDQIHQ